MRFYIAVTLMVFSLFPHNAQSSPEQDFWKWFQDNEASLFDFEKNQDAVFDRLATALHGVHPSLTFEFGPKQGNHREFVISADGNKDAFPEVSALYDAAPKLPRWTFIKFRPRRESMDISYNGISVRAQDVLFAIAPDGDRAGITLFIPGYTGQNHETMMRIAFLMLDQALGEFDVETRVGFIEVKSLQEAPKTKKPLKELPKTFDAFLSPVKPFA